VISTDSKQDLIIHDSSIEQAMRTRAIYQSMQRDLLNKKVERLNDVKNSTKHNGDIETEEIDELVNEVNILEENFNPIDHNIFILENNENIESLCEPSNSSSSITRNENSSNERLMEREAIDKNMERKWTSITDRMQKFAFELAESLRTIIEPTIATRLQGDYCTGKRLNMRRIIPYIASDYRKDKIWMRRTKKGKRNYQICIAIDDSSSMADNRITEITCNSVCIIEKAFRLLEVGQLSICKFGESVQLLSDFSAEIDPFFWFTFIT